MKRRVPVGEATIETADGTADRQPIINTAFDMFTTEEGESKPSAAARIQRSGSKLLSIVGLQARGNGRHLVFPSYPN